MPQMLVQIGRDHLDQLAERLPTADFGTLGRIFERSIVTFPGDDAVAGPSLDDFVQRCIGTTVELEQHQRNGGSILLAYPDGTFRQITVDTSQAGGPLPTIAQIPRGLGRRFFGRQRYRS